MKTVPTLLTLDKFELADQLELFQNYYSRIQIDVADGVLVPNVTTQIDELTELISQGHVVIQPQTTFDFHLMTKNFKAEIEKINQFAKLNIRVNAILINASLRPKLDELSEICTFPIGLDIFPSTEIDTISRYYDLKRIKHIQIMTVEPGFQGSPFLPEMLKKIELLREAHYEGEMLIDGGVNSNSLKTIEAQNCVPDVICIGSYLTKAGEDLEKRVDFLKSLE